MSHENACRRAFARYVELQMQGLGMDASDEKEVASNDKKNDANRTGNGPTSNGLANENGVDDS